MLCQNIRRNPVDSSVRAQDVVKAIDISKHDVSRGGAVSCGCDERAESCQNQMELLKGKLNRAFAGKNPHKHDVYAGFLYAAIGAYLFLFSVNKIE